MDLAKKYNFKKVCDIIPLTNKDLIILYSPRVKYNNKKNLPLNTHGYGLFCKFTIPDNFRGYRGIYFLFVENKIMYIGECVDLYKRFNSGYGNISPKNCYKGGQSTNCKINKKIIKSIKKGKKVELFFYNIESKNIRKEKEKELIKENNPKWNTQSKLKS